MGSEYRHDFTENLEAVARGVRRIEDVSDPELRDAIRTALGLEGEGPGLDAARRARIRRIVLAAASPQPPRPSDRAIGFLTVLAAPAPYAVRFLAAVILGLGLVAGATVASADSLPDDVLYGVKLAAEQVRLALAVAPEDRASVELSLAEHRLGEAERLAARGSESGALIATSAYAAHLASAAAELSQVEALAPRAPALLAQLESRLALQRTRAAGAAQRLLADPRTALAGAVLGTVATAPRGSGATAASRIANSAAAVSARLSAVADDRARSGPVDEHEDEESDDDDAPRTPERPPPLAPRDATTRAASTRIPGATRTPSVTRSPSASRTPATAAPAAVATAGTRELQAATPRPTPKSTVRPTTRPTVDPSARVAAEKAKEAAAKAKLAAERSKTTPTPKPTKSPRR